MYLFFFLSVNFLNWVSDIFESYWTFYSILLKEYNVYGFYVSLHAAYKIKIELLIKSLKEKYFKNFLNYWLKKLQ